jgi:hypothetical protein
MGDNIALPRQTLENRDKYFLAEVGASTRVLVSERALPSASASSSLSSSSSSGGGGGGSSSGQAPMAASFSTSSSATGLVARGVPPILPYLAIILRGTPSSSPSSHSPDTHDTHDMHEHAHT